MHRTRGRAALATAALSVVSLSIAAMCSACSDGLEVPSAASASLTSDSSGAGTASNGSTSLDFTSCGKTTECATLSVPLDYDDANGDHIDIAVNRTRAQDPSKRIGVLLVNPGGPGGSGLDFATHLPLPQDVLDRFDIIGFDPRGVGESSALDCGTNTVPAFRKVDSAPDDAAEQTALDTAAKTVADDCGSHGGPLLDHVGTDDVVRDMDAIRQALGEDQINFYGASYGSLLGLRYLALFPSHARAVVLDGVVDPSQGFTDFLRGQAIAFEKAINAVFDACASGPGCPPGGARAAYDQVAARVETQPIPSRVGGSLGPAELPVSALLPAYSPSSAAIFDKGLADALRGDGTTLMTLFESYEESAEYAVYAGVECTDSPHPVGADAYRAFADSLLAISPRFGGALANELLPCAFWPAPVHDITGAVVAADGPPVLVVGNTGDAATPYQQAVTVAQTLAHGRLLTLDGAGHTALGRGDCVAGAEADYLVDLQLPEEGTVCTP